MIRTQLKKFINNVQISSGLPDYFGSKDAITYDGVATMWFDSTAAFRMYVQATMPSCKVDVMMSPVGHALFNGGTGYFPMFGNLALY